MRKKKVLVHGTLKSLQKFFSDAESREFEIVAVLSEEPEKISPVRDNEPLDVFTPQTLPKMVYGLVDGIIITDIVANRGLVKVFLKQGVEPRKIILWDEQEGWGNLNLPDKDGTQVIYFCGLAFHLRNDADVDFFNDIYMRFQNQRYMKNLDPRLYPVAMEQDYQRRMGKPLDLNNVKTFTEKLWWIKLYDATPLKSRLADKFLVRRWVADKIGEQYLIPLLGVWDDFDDIDFDELPDQFVLKCNHGAGMNIIVRDKKSFDKRNAREKLNAWLAVDYSAQLGLELHYTRIKRKIIAEKFMTNGDLPDLTDYKFSCFNGKINHCKVISGHTTDLRLDYFDMNWHRLKFEQKTNPNSDHPERIPPPKNFELMTKLAATLSEGFAFVRVDFYEIDGKVYFGEMTFTPGAGHFYYKSAGTDEYLGSLLKLPAPTPPPALVSGVDYRVRQKFLGEVKFPPPPKLLPERKIIASLTSWMKRIGTVHLAIQTILNQTRRPDLTVLYLATEEFPRRENDLPRELLALCSDRFEIRWTKNIRSYKKLIPALKDFPDDIIITFDDDLFYHPEIIERLLAGYRKYPALINCHRINNIFIDEAGNHDFAANHFIPYDKPTYLNKLTGVCGVLYPPHCLHEDVLDEDKFMTLAPTNDDIWFWLMGVLNGRRVNVVENNINELNYISDTQDVSLWHKNNLGDRLLFKDLEKIFNAYPVLQEILLYEQRLANGK